MAENRVFDKFASHEFVDGYHQARKLLEEVVHEGFVGFAEHQLHLVGELSVMVLLIPNESQQIGEQIRIILSEFLELRHQALV